MRAIAPKLLGTYENELHPILMEITKSHYSSFVDVGCAEGYYAVGFALCHPTADIFAFDVDQDALDSCKKMAELNQVNIHLGEFCDRETLLSLGLGSRSLILIDCEGYEIELLDSALAHKLSSHDFLIEAHDFIEPGATGKLLKVFEETHTCEVVSSRSERQKTIEYGEANLRPLLFHERQALIAEHRPETMHWIFARAVNPTNVGQ